MSLGTIAIDRENWKISCEPHVRNRLRRVFPQVSQRAGDHISITRNAENARDLLWFTQRYPLTVDKGTLKQLKNLAHEHEETETAVQTLLNAIHPPQDFELAVPARDYQTDKPFNRLKASIAPLIGHHPCAKIFVILTTA